ncbi:hypothetical protein L6452_11418 [Arctium lappa]|uniref:Uncharacterized protein n=1 Tax=Arctium lappa TaxID=4217 RepID=A0ACB9DPH8_ARCLA|nr:hypothetical protein L6452_11418 [Arctium lappa]
MSDFPPLLVTISKSYPRQGMGVQSRIEEMVESPPENPLMKGNSFQSRIKEMVSVITPPPLSSVLCLHRRTPPEIPLKKGNGGNLSATPLLWSSALIHLRRWIVSQKMDGLWIWKIMLVFDGREE